MVKDHSDSERGNPLPPHGLLFTFNSKGSFICTIHRQDSTYHSLCYTSRGALAGTRNSSMGPPHEGSIHRTMSEHSTSELCPAPICVHVKFFIIRVNTSWITHHKHSVKRSQVVWVQLHSLRIVRPS